MKPFALIVEDDPLLSELFSHALEDINYETDVIADGRKALERLFAQPPDLVVLDLHLPFVSGEDILKKLKADQRFNDTKVMIVTADATMGMQLNQTVDLMLNKPVDIFQLQRLADRLKPR